MVAVPSIGRASLLEPQAAAPEAAATHGLYERHAARIHGYCLHQLGSPEEAEDAVQTTFMNAFGALGKGVVPESELAWLYKIAENVCLSRRRSSWRRNRIESPADFGLIEEIVPGPNYQRDELIGIEDALAAMPEQQRRAILLREWQGLSYREISAELELSQSAVETLIFRARRSLAQGLTEPASLKPQSPTRRRSLRRTLHLADVATLFGAVKSLLTGAAALKATAAAVVVTAAAGTAVTVSSDRPDPPPKPPLGVSAAPPVGPPAQVAPRRPSAAPAVAAVAVSQEPAAQERKPIAKEKARAVPAAKKAEPRARGVGRRNDRRPVAPIATEPLEPVAAPTPDRAQRDEAKADVRAERQEQKADKRAARAERKPTVNPTPKPVAVATAAEPAAPETKAKEGRKDKEKGASQHETPAPVSSADAPEPATAEPASEAAEGEQGHGSGKAERKRD